MTPGADLAALLAEPAWAAEVPAREALVLLDALAVQEGRCRLVRELLTARLRPDAVATAQTEEPDLVDVTTAARLAGLDPAYLRKHSREFPFRREVTPGRIRYSRHGITEWNALPDADRRAVRRERLGLPALRLASHTRLRIR